MTTNESKAMSCIGIATSALLLVVISVLLEGVVISFFWRWFIIPIFGVQPITIAEALGLALFAGMFTNKKATSNKDETTSLSTVLAVSFLSPLLALGVGYIVHLFM
jgi:cell division protein FtsW (lipid II flippase)